MSFLQEWHTINLFDAKQNFVCSLCFLYEWPNNLFWGQKFYLQNVSVLWKITQSPWGQSLSAIVFCCKKWHNLFGARFLLPAAIMFLLRRRARELSCNMTGPAKTKPQLQVLLITSLSLSLSTLLCFHLSPFSAKD